jgi:hypothetical protein
VIPVVVGSNPIVHPNNNADVCGSALAKAKMAVRGVELQKEIAAALGEPPPFESEDEFEKAKGKAATVAEFAASEAAQGFAYLFGLCTVRLWALLEALVDEIVVAALREPRLCKDQAIIGKLKGPLVEFQSAPAAEQAEFLAETLKQAVDASLKPGAGRFEAAAPAPFVAALLLTYGNHRPWGVAWYIVALSLITALSLIVGSETRTSNIEVDDVGYP